VRHQSSKGGEQLVESAHLEPLKGKQEDGETDRVVELDRLQQYDRVKQKALH